MNLTFMFLIVMENYVIAGYFDKETDNKSIFVVNIISIQNDNKLQFIKYNRTNYLVIF